MAGQGNRLADLSNTPSNWLYALRGQYFISVLLETSLPCMARI